MKLHDRVVAKDDVDRAVVDITDTVMASGLGAKLVEGFAQEHDLQIPLDAISFFLRRQRERMQLIMSARGMSGETSESYDFVMDRLPVDTQEGWVGSERLAPEELVALRKAAPAVPRNITQRVYDKVRFLFMSGKQEEFVLDDEKGNTVSAHDIATLADLSRLTTDRLFEQAGSETVGGGKLLQLALTVERVVKAWGERRKMGGPEMTRVSDAVLKELGYDDMYSMS